MGFFDWIVVPFGYVFRVCYHLVGNYGFALFLFTVIFRLLFLPLNIKSQKGTAGSMMISGKQQALRKKYADNKEKLNQEMMRIYEEEKIKPTAGCLPMIIQMLLFYPVYFVIYKPLTYIVGVSSDVITKALEILSIAPSDRSGELSIIRHFGEDTISSLFSPDVAEQIRSLNFNLFGIIDLTGKPEISHPNILWLIPLMAGVTSLLFSFISMKMNKTAATGGGMGAIMYIMPLFSIWICFTLPAGVGFYWTCSNLVGIPLQMFLNKYYSAPVINARKELKERREREEREQKIMQSRA